jgi:hypothetical protein
MTVSTFTAAFHNERATRRPRAPRTPIAVRLGRLAAKTLPRFAALRRTVMITAGFGALSYAAYEVAHPAGIAAAGVSLLLLDWLSGSDQ